MVDNPVKTEDLVTVRIVLLGTKPITRVVYVFVKKVLTPKSRGS